MSEDSSYNRDQKKEEERSVVLDFSGSLGKGMLANEELEILKNSSGLTPIGFGLDIHNLIMDRENNELKRTEMNSLKTLHPFDEIYSIKKKSVSLIEGFSDNEGLETLKNSSGLTPLNYDTEPPIKAPRVENPQDFDNGKRRNSPQRTLRTQSPSLTNLANQGE